MSDNSNQNISGMVYPTQKAMISGTPRESALMSTKIASQSQTNANKLMSGGKLKNKLKGGDNKIVVPQFNMLYTPQGGNGTNPNDLIKSNSQISTQMAANSVYDNYATTKGGFRKKKGGNPDWVWGCMSGGFSKKKNIKKKQINIKKHVNIKNKYYINYINV
jgi:hypothetical protein